MNKERRKKLETVQGLLSASRALLEEISEDERMAVDNMPEAFKESETGERREEICSMLEESVGTLEELESVIDECLE